MRRRRTFALLAAGVAWTAVAGGGPACVPEEPECSLAVVRDDGWIPVVEPTTTPWAVGEMSRVMCVRGIVPCGPETGMPLSSDESVVRVLRDATLEWVYYLGAVAPGRAEVRQTCPDEGEAVYEVEVR